MLKLTNIVKNYPIDGTNFVHALKNVSVDFKENELVAILGQSGCGKTTLLNIIGGLDRYTEGDLIVDGVSTKNFSDRDWDNYRNKRIGIVFQSYNLIPHLTVLGNVEIAMTLSGTSIHERKERAISALNSVGLQKEINKKPNQLSGGQMQRVAIARAIVNNPGIILADEPSGALDSKTSIQIMDILKNLSKDHLVIMVTHNQELADTYATRIITISDGEITSDKELTQNLKVVPKVDKKEEVKEDVSDITLVDENFKNEVNDCLKGKKKKEKTSMSFFTALNISAQNLRTKKGRTIMTAIAGSIGIIGVALVLAVSNGFSLYINNLQSETLAQFPISIEEYGVTSTTIKETIESDKEKYPDSNEVIVQQPMTNSLHVNDISDDYIEYVKNIDQSLVSSIQYNHSIYMNVLSKRDSDNLVFSFSTGQQSLVNSLTSSSNKWTQTPGNADFILNQYDVIEGHYPTSANEVFIVVDRYNNVLNTTLSSLGYDDYDKNSAGDEVLSFEKILNHKFKVVDNNSYYKKSTETTSSTGIFIKPQYELDNAGLKLSKLSEYILALSSAQASGNKTEVAKYAALVLSYLQIPEGITLDPTKLSDSTYLASFLASINQTKELNYYTYLNDEEKTALFNDSSKGIDLSVVGILRPKATTMTPLLSSGIYYTEELTNLVVNTNYPKLVDSNGNGKIDKEEDTRSEIAKSYENNASISLLDSSIKVRNIINNNNLSTSSSAFTTYISQRKVLGTENYISSISIYPKNFNNKKDILLYLDKYNADKDEVNQVLYTDLASMITSSMGTIVDVISYVLIAFASISLVVSSVMIGIITYTSVIERTKEIGILRSVGARKKDVGRLFKAEAVIIGFLSGVVGIALAYIICFPINLTLDAIYPEYNVGNIASLNPLHAVLLVILSSGLTYIASVIPSRVAAKKDPVVALRSE